MILFAVPTIAIAGSMQESVGIEILNKWLGSWKSHTILKTAAWSLKAKELSGTSKIEWILDGQFQQVSNQSEGYESREINRYDAKSKKYQKWTFNSDGGTSFWIGSWNEESSTMTWEYIDFGLGITGEIVDRFVSDRKYKTTLVMKDSIGNLLLDIRSEHTRTMKQSK